MGVPEDKSLRLSYEERAEKAINTAAKTLFGLMESKKTNLALNDDEVEQKRFLELAESLGSEIVILKTHIDILRDFTPEVTKKLLGLSKKHNFMIFEDRKFADIGNTVKMQYTEGIYRIADWANIVNVHAVPGPGIIKALGEVIKERNDGIPRGIIVLAQMSSEGNLATGDYTKQAIEMTNANKELTVGYIGDGGDVTQLRKLTALRFEGHAVLTPGVQIQSKGDTLGQKYSLPEDAVAAGSDVIMVGRGIYKADNPLEMAKDYRKRGWNAYLKRTEQ